ncbi:hypothetical protein U9M48_030768, partial [Paspalum notatum var. saurae]
NFSSFPQNSAPPPPLLLFFPNEQAAAEHLPLPPWALPLLLFFPRKQASSRHPSPKAISSPSPSSSQQPIAPPLCNSHHSSPLLLSTVSRQQQAPNPYGASSLLLPSLPITCSSNHGRLSLHQCCSHQGATQLPMAPPLLAFFSPAQNLSRSHSSLVVVRHASFSHHRRAAAAPRRWSLLPFPKVAAAFPHGATTSIPFCHRRPQGVRQNVRTTSSSKNPTVSLQFRPPFHPILCCALVLTSLRCRERRWWFGHNHDLGPNCEHEDDVDRQGIASSRRQHISASSLFLPQALGENLDLALP